MTEHEKLNEIRKLIGYQYGLDKRISKDDLICIDGVKMYTKDDYCLIIIKHPREVIFDPRFIDKIKEYVLHMDGLTDIWIDLLHNLDNPVQYLYDTLGLGTK